MNIYECERKSQKLYQDQNVRDMENIIFEVFLPNGKTLQCRWLDLYLGILEIDGFEKSLMINLFEKTFPDYDCSEPRISL